MRSELFIQIEGLMLEKLIERAMKQGSRFRSLRRTGKHTIIAETDCASGRILLALCKKFSISARIVKQHGAPVIFSFFQRRKTLLPGVFLLICLCILFFSRIWLIDVIFTGESAAYGNEINLRAVLREMDIHPGVSNRLDSSLLSQKLQASIEGYSFISARLQGVRLLIEAAPETAEPEVYDLDYARDLYAGSDGIVVSVNVQSGQAQVKPGDTIKRGQLLIRGEEQISREDTRSVGALGEVIVRTWYTGVSEGNLYTTVSHKTGCSSTASNLRLLHYIFPLSKGEIFQNQQVITEYLPIVGLFLPLEIVRETRFETKESIQTVDRELLAERLIALSMADAATQLSLYGPERFEIVRSWINFDETQGSTLRATAVYEIYTDAAATRDALLQGG